MSAAREGKFSKIFDADLNPQVAASALDFPDATIVKKVPDLAAFIDHGAGLATR